MTQCQIARFVGRSRAGGGQGSGPPHPGKVVVSALRNTNTDPLEKHWTPWVQLLLEEGTYMYGPL